MSEMSTDERVLCDIQGRLFENSLTSGYDSPTFIAAFMNSEIAEYMDKPYDRYQWSCKRTVNNHVVLCFGKPELFHLR